MNERKKEGKKEGMKERQTRKTKKKEKKNFCGLDAIVDSLFAASVSSDPRTTFDLKHNQYQAVAYKSEVRKK